MPAITKPFNLKPAEALAATASAPALAASVAAQTSTGATSMPAVAAATAHAMWAPVAATVVDDEALRQGLSATAMRRTTGIYERKTQSVTAMVDIEDQNRQALTLIPGGGSIAV